MERTRRLVVELEGGMRKGESSRQAGSGSGVDTEELQET
jgi:hypothetical protein